MNRKEQSSSGPSPKRPRSKSGTKKSGDGPKSNIPRAPSKLGRKGDPRMHRAVAIRLANPDMTLLDALRGGGFEFPDLNVLDGSVSDADSVPLCQRKNQLSRRIRLARRAMEKGLPVNLGDYELDDVLNAKRKNDNKKQTQSGQLTCADKQNKRKQAGGRKSGGTVTLNGAGMTADGRLKPPAILSSTQAGALLPQGQQPSPNMMSEQAQAQMQMLLRHSYSSQAHMITGSEAVAAEAAAAEAAAAAAAARRLGPAPKRRRGRSDDSHHSRASILSISGEDGIECLTEEDDDMADDMENIGRRLAKNHPLFGSVLPHNKAASWAALGGGPGQRRQGATASQMAAAQHQYAQALKEFAARQQGANRQRAGAYGRTGTVSLPGQNQSPVPSADVGATAAPPQRGGSFLGWNPRASASAAAQLFANNPATGNTNGMMAGVPGGMQQFLQAQQQQREGGMHVGGQDVTHAAARHQAVDVGGLNYASRGSNVTNEATLTTSMGMSREQLSAVLASGGLSNFLPPNSAIAGSGETKLSATNPGSGKEVPDIADSDTKLETSLDFHQGGRVVSEKVHSCSGIRPPGDDGMRQDIHSVRGAGA